MDNLPHLRSNKITCLSKSIFYIGFFRSPNKFPEFGLIWQTGGSKDAYIEMMNRESQ